MTPAQYLWNRSFYLSRAISRFGHTELELEVRRTWNLYLRERIVEKQVETDSNARFSFDAQILQASSDAGI